MTKDYLKILPTVDITLNTYTDASADFKKQEISLLDLRDKIEVV